MMAPFHLGVSVSQHVKFHSPVTDKLDWNAAVFNVISSINSPRNMAAVSI